MGSPPLAARDQVKLTLLAEAGVAARLPGGDGGFDKPAGAGMDSEGSEKNKLKMVRKFLPNPPPHCQIAISFARELLPATARLTANDWISICFINGLQFLSK